MLKYYFFLFLIVGLALLYAFVADPCHRQVRADFSSRYPGYRILDSSAAEGSRETVRCQISYRKPGSEQVYQDVWLYQNLGNGWNFSRILETGQKG